MKTLEVCGAAIPVRMGGQVFAVCTKKPGHKGRHGCMVDYEWPKGPVVLASSDPEEHKRIQENPPDILTFRIRAPKGDEQRPYIQAKYED